MKISTLVTILLVVGIMFFAFVSMIEEAETNYGIEVNKSEWEDQYDFAEDVNNSVAPITQSIRTISDEESGWLDILGSGFTGVIAAITFLPTMVIEMITFSSTLITGFLSAFGLPAYISLVLIIMLICWGTFKLLEALHRWQV